MVEDFKRTDFVTWVEGNTRNDPGVTQVWNPGGDDLKSYLGTQGLAKVRSALKKSNIEKGELGFAQDNMSQPGQSQGGYNQVVKGDPDHIFGDDPDFLYDAGERSKLTAKGRAAKPVTQKGDKDATLPYNPPAPVSLPSPAAVPMVSRTPNFGPFMQYINSTLRK